jgi:hypothetical protein
VGSSGCRQGHGQLSRHRTCETLSAVRGSPGQSVRSRVLRNQGNRAGQTHIGNGTVRIRTASDRLSRDELSPEDRDPVVADLAWA